MRIPIDSADAREMREEEAAEEQAEAAEQLEHATRCRGGWLGLDDDERPIPCPRCRPHLVHVACHTCSAPWRSCRALGEIHRGPCCQACDHKPGGAQ